tara:strand:+ start:9348 stop:11135 length:1788 start_codon:yes stop_codon:yes gene_type:complete
VSDKKKKKEIKQQLLTTFPIPYEFIDIEDNISISTSKNNQPNKEKIVRQALKFHSEGNIENAISYYKYCFKHGFNDPRVYSNYGIILKNKGKLKEAEKSQRKAIELKPDFTNAHYNLGNILRDLGQLKEAESSLRKALEINPNLPNAYSNLGNILKDLGKLKEAESCHRQAIKLKPDFAEAYSNLGVILRDFGKSKEAESCHRQAIELKPDFAEAYSNLGNVLKDIDNLEEAALSQRKAIDLKPNFAEAYSNLGTILISLGNLKEAEICQRKAISLKQDFAEAHINLSHILLKQKFFKEGWEEYEWRWKATDQKIEKKLETQKPEWDYQKKGKILLWREQGLGDEILFLSLINELENNVEKLLIKTDKRLIPLFKRSFDKDIEFIGKEKFIDETKYDYQLPMGSLGKYLRKTLKSFENAKEFNLTANKERSYNFRTKIINSNYKKYIGISWKSSGGFRGSSLQLEELILGIDSPGICFINLQYGEVKKEIINLKSIHGVEIKEIDELDIYNDIDGLASLITACDEVVSIDNITATLSGSLGVKTKVILPINSYWPHSIEDKKSYWFPKMNFYRQVKRNDWRQPLNEIKEAIKNSI